MLHDCRACDGMFPSNWASLLQNQTTRIKSKKLKIIIKIKKLTFIGRCHRTFRRHPLSQCPSQQGSLSRIPFTLVTGSLPLPPLWSSFIPFPRLAWPWYSWRLQASYFVACPSVEVFLMVPQVSLARSTLRSSVFGKNVPAVRPCSRRILSGGERFSSTHNWWCPLGSPDKGMSARLLHWKVTRFSFVISILGRGTLRGCKHPIALHTFSVLIYL